MDRGASGTTGSVTMSFLVALSNLATPLASTTGKGRSMQSGAYALDSTLTCVAETSRSMPAADVYGSTDISSIRLL